MIRAGFFAAAFSASFLISVIIVSCDSHAGVPKELWQEYLPSKYHELLPSLAQDNVVYPTAIYLLGRKNGTAAHPEHLQAHAEEWHGLHDATLRLADMDREGIAAETLYLGDFRATDGLRPNGERTRTYIVSIDAAKNANTR